MKSHSLEKEEMFWLHPSHHRQMRRTVITVALLMLGMVVSKALSPLYEIRGIAGYLPLHTLLETVSVVIAMLVFAVGWNAYRRGLPSNILLLSCAFFGVGVLDFTHTLSYKGMPDFVTPSGVEKAIYFWLAARSIAAIALFLVAVKPWRPFTSATSRYNMLGAVLILIGCLHWLFLFHADLAPQTFITGQGLTPFKIVYEYALIALNIITAFVLWICMRKPQSFNAAGLFGAVCTMALSEIFFTLYANSTDIYNLLGHLYKVLSYFFLYRAIFVATIEYPYNQLRASQNKLQATLDAMPDLLLEIGLDGHIYDYHTANTRQHAASASEYIGKSISEIMPPEAVEICMSALHEAQQNAYSQGKQIELITQDGKRWYELSVSRKTVEPGQEPRFIVLSRDIMDRKASEAAIVKSQNLLLTVIDNTPMRIFWKDCDLRYLGCNMAFAKDAGLMHPKYVVGKDDYQMVWAVQAESYRADDNAVMESGIPKLSYDEPQTTSTGRTVWIRTSKVPLRNQNNEPLGIMGIYEDITERKLADDDLRIAATAFESQEGMMVTDANKVILRVNKAFSAITGYSTEEAIGQTPRLLSSDRHNAAFYAAMWECINNTGTWVGEVWSRRKNGEVYPEHLTISAVKDANGTVTNYVATLVDITMEKAAAEEIQHLAFYDPLTHLPNRRLLLDRLNHALAASERSGRQGALLFLDLDHFKTLNDTCGHYTGDLLLQQVAERLTSCVRECDTLARLGGDEFVIALEDLSEQDIDAAAQAKTIANKILAAINQPYPLATHEYHSTASIGVTLFNEHQSAEELLKQADIAMYQAKKAGRNTLRFFNPQMQDAINARVSLEGELRKALDNRQFQLHYQIQVDHSGHPLGAEALIRWLHPERGLVSPFHFIPLAEETGLILAIGGWVLETACAQLKAWQQDVLTRDLTLSVNVSAKQFRQADFLAQVQAAVQRHAIDPMLLKLELTESLLLENIEDTIASMGALTEIGMQLSLDDFGTGYSSLQYLKRLPLYQLKIDQSFVRDIAVDSNDRSIVRTIIAMAQNLNLNVIAEGVETQEQRELLLSSGCKSYQGYLFGRPVSIEQFEAALKQV